MVEEKLDTYTYFMRPEPRDNLGPIRVIHDDFLNRKIKVRDVSIGMTRNAKQENRKTFQAYLEPFPHIRIATAKPLQGWYKGLHEPKNVRNRPCYTEALLTEPYGGSCSVGCTFCYINSGFRGYRGTGLVTVPLNYGEQLKKQLSKMYRGSAAYFTSFTDPFLPLERWYHNSQKGAQACVDIGLPIFFLSRLKYPTWAINLLRKNKYSYAQKSINTPDPKDWKKLSPGALPLQDHFKDITRLKNAGIYVSIQVNPVLPGITTNKQIVKLFRMLAEAGADHVIVKFAEAGYSWASTMEKRFIAKFGERGRSFAKLFTDNIGGQRSIQEEYRLRAHAIYRREADKCGLTYSVCYEYKYERDSSGIIISKTGISLGPELTTSAQCHGQRVPVYTRKDLKKKFRPIKVCPPSGCLYCSEKNVGEPLCGDTLLGNAQALKLADFRRPIK